MGIAVRSGVAGVALCLLAACGGGGGGGGDPVNPGNPGGGGGTYTPGVFPPRADFAAQCISPRAGTSDRTGSAFTEKMFLRSWTNELYLWYAEVPDTNPTSIADVIDYFDALKTPQTTPSGNRQGSLPFHVRYRRVDRAVAGRPVDRLRRGVDAHDDDTAASRRRRVRRARHPGERTANVTRGMEVLRINGVDFVNDNTQAGVDTLNAAFFPDDRRSDVHVPLSAGGRWRRVDVPLTSANITHDAGAGLPRRSIRAATGRLHRCSTITSRRRSRSWSTAINTTAGRERAGPDPRPALQRRRLPRHRERAGLHDRRRADDRQTFERWCSTARTRTRNPVTGQPLAPTPFHTTTQDFEPGRPDSRCRR